MNGLSDFRYRDLYIFALSLIVFGLFASPISDIGPGIVSISKSPSVLISDYIEIGGIGASFINAGFMTLLAVILAHRAGARITGAILAGVFIVAGFSFFGKNIINSLPLMVGVYIYLKVKGLELANHMHIVFFVTGYSPIVSLFMYGLGLSQPVGAVAGVLVGLFVGLITIPTSTSMLRFHDGYSLYNVGFSLGMVGVIAAGILRMFDIEIPSYRHIYEGDDTYMLAYLLFLCLGLVAYGLIKNRGTKGYGKILSSSGRLISDFTLTSSKPLVLLNMGLLGIFCIIYVKVSGGVFNGPIVGGILTVVGFAAFGKHLRNVIPVMVGVFIASFLNKYDIASTDAILVALFSSTLAPIGGEFGLVAGILAGFIHKSVATNVGFVHAGINLYNNGFAGGIVAGFLVPILRSFNERYKRD